MLDIWVHPRPFTELSDGAGLHVHERQRCDSKNFDKGIDESWSCVTDKIPHERKSVTRTGRLESLDAIVRCALCEQRQGGINLGLNEMRLTKVVTVRTLNVSLSVPDLAAMSRAFKLPYKQSVQHTDNQKWK